MKGLLQYGFSIALLGVSFAGTVNAQTIPNSSNQSNGTGNRLNYPYGTRIYPNGSISTPRSWLITPSVRVPRGDGSTTYYYPNGTQITIEKDTISPSGTTLYPGVNGGLNHNRLSNPNILPQNQLRNNRIGNPNSFPQNR